MVDDFAALRTDYSTQGLDARDLAPDPASMFRLWFEQARVLPISDKFADNAWKLRNELVKADAQPKEGARGHDLFQLGENEFKEAVKTKSEDLEYVLAPYQDATADYDPEGEHVTP